VGLVGDVVVCLSNPSLRVLQLVLVSKLVLVLQLLHPLCLTSLVELLLLLLLLLLVILVLPHLRGRGWIEGWGR
jgi:hypothetical protein